MASAPKYKVFTPENEYIASFKYPGDAAVLVSAIGNGTTIRNGHAKRDTVWSEGSEQQPAGESYDFVAETIFQRENE